MILELENGSIEYRVANAEAELSIYPYLTGLQAKVQRYAFQTQQYTVGSIDEVPRLSIDMDDLLPVVRFVADHIVDVHLDGVATEAGEWSALEVGAKSEFVLRLGYLGVLELAKTIVESGRLKPATKKK